MRWKKAVIGMAVLALSVTACGQSPESSGAPDSLTAAPDAVTEAPPHLGAGRKPVQPPDGDGPEQSRDDVGTPVPADRIDATALPEGYPESVATDQDGRTLVIKAEEGGCSTASAEVGEQTAEQVTVTLVKTAPADPNTVCTMDIRYPALSVDLAEPLGKRTVVLRFEQRTS